MKIMEENNMVNLVLVLWDRNRGIRERWRKGREKGNKFVKAREDVCKDG